MHVAGNIDGDAAVIREMNIGAMDSPVPIDLVAALGGDRPLTPEESTAVDELERKLGDAVHSELLFSVIHQRYPADKAHDKWNNILRHKYELSQKVGRNVGIAVAALDYLANIQQDIKAPVIVSRLSMDTIRRLAIEDSLTHVANRAAVLVRLEDEIRRYGRHGTPCSLLLLDIDDFSRINDTAGHDAGDAAICLFANRLYATLRDTDLCGRFGGDEFMALLPNTAAAEASRTAERILLHVRRTALTCSIGIASCPEAGKTAADLQNRSDMALLEAKRQGKNQAVAFKKDAAWIHARGPLTRTRCHGREASPATTTP